MVTDFLGLLVGYLVFGLVLTLVGRRRPAEDWDETLLASVLAPPLFLFIAALVLGQRIYDARRANA